MTTEIGPQIGSQAADFSLLNDQKQTIALNQLPATKGLLLAFIHGTWCSACVQTLFRLRQYEKMYLKEGFSVVAIAIDSPSALNIFRRSAQPVLGFPLLSDETETVHQNYGLYHIGAYLIIDHNLTIRGRFLDEKHQGWPGHFRIMEVMQAI